MAEKKEQKKELLFTKKQIISSQRFSDYQDFLNGNLDDNKMYSSQAVNDLLDKFFKKGKGE